MDTYTKSNMLNWDDRVDLHTEKTDNSFYDIDGFINGKSTLRSIEIEELGDVRNKDLLHLQCHFGLDTLSWARLGANVTGVDFSHKAIDYAIDLSKRVKLKADFICSEVMELTDKLDSKFDIVFASYGVFCWIKSVAKWFEIASHFLKKDGILFIIDGHPMIDTLEYEDNRLDLRYSYFEGEPVIFEIEKSYTESEGKIENKTSYEWNHELSTFVNESIRNDLEIISLREYPFCFWKRYDNMKQNRDGWWEFDYQNIKLPFMFSLKARKT